MRGDRWREVEVCYHEREDGAAVRCLDLHGGRGGGFGWIGSGPDRAPLTDPHGRERRFRTAAAAKVAVDRAWP